MNTPHDHTPLDLGAALHQIATGAGDQHPDDTAPMTSHARASAARRRRRHHMLVATVTVGVLALGGGAWAFAPTLFHHEPLPAITDTPTPSHPPTPTPYSPTPEPSPTATETPTPQEPPITVPNGFTSETYNFPAQWDYTQSAAPFLCGERQPSATRAELLMTATIGQSALRMPSGSDGVEATVVITTLDTVIVNAAEYTPGWVISQNGVVVSAPAFGSDSAIPFGSKPGAALTVPEWVGRAAYCGYEPTQSGSLAPGRYEVSLVVPIAVSSYSLQQRDGSWGAVQQTPGPGGFGEFLHLVTPPVPLIVE